MLSTSHLGQRVDLVRTGWPFFHCYWQSYMAVPPASSIAVTTLR
jgi:hypothetical protein